ncbi:MAG: arginine deiminase [Eubacteriales bacterium]|nr:arginine deiminase [Eubacteriales bacterium]MDD3349579.1 arginine deiminase [Eubacteriales bacterium]
MSKGVNIYSEIGKLNKVMIHRMGREIEGLVPDNFERLLFDDIPHLQVAQKEHDRFAEILTENGVEVVYFAEEAAIALHAQTVREAFIKDFIEESGVLSPYAKEAIFEMLMGLKPQELVNLCIAGIRKDELSVKAPISLAAIVAEDYPYYTDPMPNLYFTRDPGACIGDGVSVNSMKTDARRRESLLLKYMFNYDDELFPNGTNLWFNREPNASIEGGDILPLSPEVVAIGLSERTSAEAISTLAERILRADNSFKKIIVFRIPKRRAFMHLDTVFTMVDFDKFTIHPEIEGPLDLYEICLDKDGKSIISVVTDSLEVLLKTELKLPAVELIRCGGTDKIAAQREQWNDGSNTLAIAPGVVITYDRNYVTNDLLDKKGVKVLSIPSSEISRGRGGPRCMSMPINRDDL